MARGLVAESPSGFGGDDSVKGKLVKILSSVRTAFRMPLIFLNALTIVYLVLLG